MCRFQLLKNKEPAFLFLIEREPLTHLDLFYFLSTFIRSARLANSQAV
jgi:hypothetical protein